MITSNITRATRVPASLFIPAPFALTPDWRRCRVPHWLHKLPVHYGYVANGRGQPPGALYPGRRLHVPSS
jgi:hypothetical protein